MKVSGKILDTNDSPLIRATIKKITGTSANQVGTYSNEDGSFELDSNSISPNDEFLITYIGFEPQRLYASELSNKTIKMVEKDLQIEEVVVTNRPKSIPQESTNKFSAHLQKHKILYAGIGGFLGLALIFSSIKKL